jgi:hypothetical protein
MASRCPGNGLIVAGLVVTLVGLAAGLARRALRGPRAS